MTYSPRALMLSNRIPSILTRYLLPIGLVALLAGLPFFPDKSLYHRFFYLFICIPALLLLILRPTQTAPLLREPIFLALLAFITWTWLSIGWSTTDEDRKSLFKWPLYLLLFSYAMFQYQQYQPSHIFKVLQVSGLLVLLATLYALFKTIPHLTPGYRMIGTGALSNPLLSSHLFGFFAVYWIVCATHSTKHRSMLLNAIAALVMLFAVAATGSRTPFVALALVAVWMSALRPNKTMLVLLSSATLAAAGILIALAPANFIERGASYRPEIWHKAITLIEQSPWIGHGYSSPLAIRVDALNTTFSEPHSFALGVLYDLGLVGLVFWLAMQFLTLKEGWTHRQDWRFVLVSALMVYGIGAGLTEGGGILSRPKEHWFLIWIPLALMIALSATARPRHARITPRLLDQPAFAKLCQNARVIEEDGLGPKVLELADGTFLKLFRRKQWPSSARLSSYGQRFASHALALTERQINAPTVLDLFRLPDGGTAVRYQPLPGQTLRHALAESEQEERRQLVQAVGRFFGQLHERGVYFRSLHLGNVLLMPNGKLALIDIADMRLFNIPLSTRMRHRNLKHMQRYSQDRHWLFEEQREALLEGYALGASTKSARQLLPANETPA